MVHQTRHPRDEHLINVLTIGDEFIATCRCGWKHSCESMKDHKGREGRPELFQVLLT